MWLVCYLFFGCVLQKSSALLPSLALFLGGVALGTLLLVVNSLLTNLCNVISGPLTILLGMVVHRPEALVVDIPVVVFVLMLPGLLYSDLVFDVQRSTQLELGLSLLPPSAVALLLREVFYVESMGAGATVQTRFPVSHTSLLSIMLVLVLDIVIYSVFAAILYTLSSVTLDSKAKHWWGQALYLSRALGRLLWNLCFSDNSLGAYDEIIDVDSGHEKSTPLSSRSEMDRLHDLAETVVWLRRVKKTFTLSSGQRVEVLSDISADLKLGFITCFLGGNGAGKSTLLKLLCGLDPNFEGIVRMNQRIAVSSTSHTRRMIGYCPQSDALFDFLTVRENLALFYELDALASGSKTSTAELNSEVDKCLSKLDMLQHSDKLVHQLSGGMKRRVSLALAFVGDPVLVLLDEPTTGCDSYTRELVRNDILSRKTQCAVVVSTHHMDDVELLADRIWFLNEKYLQVNSSLAALKNNCIFTVEIDGDGTSSTTAPFTRVLPQNQADLTEFSTSSVSVATRFRKKFASAQVHWKFHAHSSPYGEFECENYVWRIPHEFYQKLLGFIAGLEAEGEINWRVNAPRLGHGLVQLMGSKKYYSGRARTSSSVSVGVKQEAAANKCKDCWDCGHMMGPVMRIRFEGLRQKRLGLLRASILMPFAVACIISLSCANLVYPLLKLNSKLFNGVGEVPLSWESTMNISQAQYITSLAEVPLVSDCRNAPVQVSKVFEPAIASNSAFMSCYPNTNSDDLYQLLFDEYYCHRENRWTAYAVNDTMPKWAESSIALTVKNDTTWMTSSGLFNDLQAAKDSLCVSPSVDLWTAEASTKQGPSSGLPICNTDINMFNKTSIKLSSYKSMSSRLAMIANISLDHIAPVFVKEIVSTLYGALQAGERDRNGTSAVDGELLRSNGKTNKPHWKPLVDAPRYSLSSEPLALNGFMNKTYLERGYLGAVVMALFMQMTAIAVVKYVVRIRQTQAKIQMHLAGVGAAEYWLWNWLVDVALLLVAYSAILLAIVVCGRFLSAGPVMTVFGFSSKHLWLVLTVIVMFAAAVVPASYLFCFNSVDPLSAQLSLLICNIMGGVLLRLIVDAQTNHQLDAFAGYWMRLSPTFAFTTAMFDMFALAIQDSIPSLIKRSTSVDRVMDALRQLAVQAVGYMLAVILLDINVGRFELLWSKLIAGLTYCERIGRGSDQTSHTSAIELSMLNSNPSRTERSPLVNRSSRSQSYSSTTSQENNEDDPGQMMAPVGGGNVVRRLSFRSGEGFPSGDDDIESYRPTQSPVGCFLRISQLSLRYDYFSNFAIKDLCLDIHKGERVALVGINGGGKSSLFRHLAMGQLVQVEGESHINKLNLVSEAFEIAGQGLLGYVPQDGGLIDYLSVHDYVDIFSGAARKYEKWSQCCARRRSGFDVLLESPEVDKEFLIKYAKYPVHALSGGNKKKLALLLARLTSPALLLLDECTSGVDPIAAEAIVQQLHSLRPHQSMLFTSHRVDECIDICNRVVMLSGGRTVFDGPTSSFESLSTQFYQVDVWFATEPTELTSADGLSVLLAALQADPAVLATGHAGLTERAVYYGVDLCRITFDKTVVPLSVCWRTLEAFQTHSVGGQGPTGSQQRNSSSASVTAGCVSRYSFRAIDMEEILAILIAHTKTRMVSAR
jgi:ABC-type multidrug transport system ATPase subunit